MRGGRGQRESVVARPCADIRMELAEARSLVSPPPSRALARAAAPPRAHPRALAETLTLHQDLALATLLLGRRVNTVAEIDTACHLAREYPSTATSTAALSAAKTPPRGSRIPNQPGSERHLLVRQLSESTGPDVARQALNPMRGARGRVPREGELGPTGTEANEGCSSNVDATSKTSKPYIYLRFD